MTLNTPTDAPAPASGSRPSGPESSARPATVHLRAAGVSLLLDCTGELLPSIVHWGPDLGDLDEREAAEIASAGAALLDNTLDIPLRVSLLPEGSAGWMGTPGLSGHRGQDAWSPRFTTEEIELDPSTRTLRVRGEDAHAGLSIRFELVLHDSGLLAQRATLQNIDSTPYQLEQLALSAPVPPIATEILDLTGRWSRERSPQRLPLVVGTHLRENRRGRTGADAATILAVGEAGFGYRRGEVWTMHVGFSGNHRAWAEHTSGGLTQLGGGELLLPGEQSLAPGEAYETPWVFGSYGDGLDEAAGRFHDHLRARPQHPSEPRKVVANTWEAVYFDHDLDRLTELARAAAAVGVERFVLDDGWFLGRRDDTTALGDWEVDPELWPEGLHPLVNAVRELGMDFGLWFEPEMLSPDSRLAREHPDWMMRTGGRDPLLGRNQQVLDLGNPDAFDHVLERISALVDEYAIDYIKWDHNRDLIDAGSVQHSRAGVHDQTLAVYRMWAELRGRHPELEIESCSSGGARVDLGALALTDRVWVSDCIEPLERQSMMNWTAQLLPLELLGSHVGSARSHTTGRTHDLRFRAATALFGHFGIECDVTAMSAEDRDELAAWVALYKKLRPLLHSGRAVRIDHPLDEVLAHGVVSADRRDAVFSMALLETPATWPIGRIRLPGLDPDLRYLVERIGPAEPRTRGGSDPVWWSSPLRASGRTLAAHGIQAPTLLPEQAVVLRVTAEGSAG